VLNLDRFSPPSVHLQVVLWGFVAVLPDSISEDHPSLSPTRSDL
jgi:hypothetical protein